MRISHILCGYFWKWLVLKRKTLFAPSMKCQSSLPLDLSQCVCVSGQWWPEVGDACDICGELIQLASHPWGNAKRQGWAVVIAMHQVCPLSTILPISSVLITVWLSSAQWANHNPLQRRKLISRQIWKIGLLNYAVCPGRGNIHLL